jgi:hypothetical protein
MQQFFGASIRKIDPYISRSLLLFLTIRQQQVLWQNANIRFVRQEGVAGRYALAAQVGPFLPKVAFSNCFDATSSAPGLSEYNEELRQPCSAGVLLLFTSM